MTKLLIPEAALKKHIAILGMNGSGKTSVAKSQIIEPALDAGERVCNIDPTGVGWGLRLTASGKSKGYPVYIVGGDHADFPLFRRDGHAWAEIVGTSSDSFIFDTSAMTVKHRSLWFTDFAETLIRKNNGSLKFILDEAHLFAPQGGANAGGVAPDMLHATNNLLALGRSKGLRITMISQRPAKLHKDSLTQAHSLIAMMLIAPQDRSAVKDWIADQADPETGKEIIASLPSLAPGEGWLWAPRERVLARLKFPRPHTFDSSSAPDERDGEAVTLSPINPDAIKAKLATVAKETVANDPKVLRSQVVERDREIATLRQQLTYKSTAEAVPDKDALDSAEQRGFEQAKKKLTAAAVRTVEAIVRAAMTAIDKRLREGFADAREKISDDIVQVGSVTKVLGAEITFEPSAPAPQQTARPVQQKPVLVPRPPREAVAGDGTYNGPQMKVLRSLAMWRALGHEAPTRPMVAAVAGYRPGTGRFGDIVGSLVTAGAVDKPGAGLLSLLADNVGVMTKDEGRALLLATLDNPQKKLIAPMIDAGEKTREQLAPESGYQAGTGRFGDLVGSLVTMGIFVKPGVGRLGLSDWAQELLSGYAMSIAA